MRITFVAPGHHVEEQPGKDDSAIQRREGERPAHAQPRQAQPKQQSLVRIHPARGERAFGRALHLRVNVPVINHIEQRASADCQEQAPGQGQQCPPCDNRTARAHVPGQTGNQEESGLEVVYHERNRGKGAALRTGFGRATGDILIIQDADLEYDPIHYRQLIQPIVEGVADVVYGSRFVPTGPHRVLYYWHFVANRVLTTLSNMFTDLNLTDMETCYKVFRREVIEAIGPTLKEKRFGIEAELTAKVARRKYRVYEVGITYFGRTYGEGKKIGLRDAFRALWCILRYWKLD